MDNKKILIRNKHIIFEENFEYITPNLTQNMRGISTKIMKYIWKFIDKSMFKKLILIIIISRWLQQLVEYNNKKL